MKTCNKTHGCVLPLDHTDLCQTGQVYPQEWRPDTKEQIALRLEIAANDLAGILERMADVVDALDEFAEEFKNIGSAPLEFTDKNKLIDPNAVSIYPRPSKLVE